MSLRMIDAVKGIIATPTQRFVAWVLADCHNDATGRCDPSGQYLERMTGFSNRTIWTAIHELEKAGHLSIKNSGNGSRNCYVLHFKTSEGGSQVECENQCSSFTSEGGSPVKEVHKTSEGGSHGPVKEVHKTSEGGSHKPERTGIEPERTGTIRAKSRKEDGSDFQNACMVELDMKAGRIVKLAWIEWQQYRQSRHLGKGSDKLPWTAQAARLSAVAIVRAVEKHGEQIISDRVHAAIAGRWKGLNLDKLEQSKPSQFSPTQNRYGQTEAERRAAVLNETHRIRSLPAPPKPVPPRDRVTLDDLKEAKANLNGMNAPVSAAASEAPKEPTA